MRVRTSPIDSDALSEMQACSTLDLAVLAFELYVDGATLSESGANSANLVRIRLTNLKGRAHNWLDVGIALVLLDTASYADAKLKEERAILFQRYIFLLFRDLIVASRDGLFVDGTLFNVRLFGIVADQPQ